LFVEGGEVPECDVGCSLAIGLRRKVDARRVGDVELQRGGNEVVGALLGCGLIASGSGQVRRLVCR
jgi:hypothetical protein